MSRWVTKRDLQREVRDWEPHQALFAGPTGLEIYTRLVRDAERVLRPGGWLIMELGFNSSERVAAMFTGSWCSLQTTPDLAGIPRVIAARLALADDETRSSAARRQRSAPGSPVGGGA